MRQAWKLAFLRKNGRPETLCRRFVVAWKQLLIEVLVGHVRRCHVAAAHAAAAGGRADRSGERSTRRRRKRSPAPREAESRSSIPRRASILCNPQLDWSVGAETLELVFHFAERRKILGTCPWVGPILANDCNYSGTSRTEELWYRKTNGSGGRSGSSSRGLNLKDGRGERIRTSDPLVPNQVRYQTALRPECVLR